MSTNGDKPRPSTDELMKQIESEINNLFGSIGKTDDKTKASKQLTDAARDAALKVAKRELVKSLYSMFTYTTSAALVAWTAKRVLRDVFGFQITFWQAMRVINAIMLAVRFIKTDGLREASLVSGEELAKKIVP